MTLPYSLYTFADQTGPIPLAQLDSNFQNVSNIVSRANIVVDGNQTNITAVGTLIGLSVSGGATFSSTVNTGSLTVNNGATIGGNLVVGTGNTIVQAIFTDNYYYANGVPFGGGGNGGGYSNSAVSIYLASGNNPNNIITTANVSANNVSVTNNINSTTVTANTISVGNITLNASNNTIQATNGNFTGNLTARTITDTGSNTNAVATTAFVQAVAFAAGSYTDANVATYLSSGTMTDDIVTNGGNIQVTNGGVFVGNGSGLTGVTSTANAVISANGNWSMVAGNSGFTTSNGNTVKMTVGNTVTFSTSVGISGELSSYSLFINGGGDIETSGNIIAGYLYGDGSNITNIYGDSNVAVYLASGNISTDIITSGNSSANVVSATTVSASDVLADSFAANTITANTSVSTVATQLAVYADATARDTAITTPADGMIVFLTDIGDTTGGFQGYANGAWGNLALS